MSEQAAVTNDVEALRGFLAERDVPCPRCKFNLRGGTKAVCPECAEPIRLIVARPEALWTMRRLLVVVVVGQVLSFGCFSIQRVGPLLRYYRSLGQLDLILSLVSVTVMLSVAIGLAVAMVRYIRHRARRDTRAEAGLLRWFLVATACSLVWSFGYIAISIFRWILEMLT